MTFQQHVLHFIYNNRFNSKVFNFIRGRGWTPYIPEEDLKKAGFTIRERTPEEIAEILKNLDLG
jgi:hypothetical protein